MKFNHPRRTYDGKNCGRTSGFRFKGGCSEWGVILSKTLPLDFRRCRGRRRHSGYVGRLTDTGPHSQRHVLMNSS